MLTKRQLTILKMIISQPGIHGTNLSESLGVTSRTIRSEIAQINNIAKILLISSNPKKGYLIEPENFRVAEEMLSHDSVNLNEQDLRMYKILANILFSDECYIYELSEILGLSESATRREVIKTLNLIKKRFSADLIELKKDKCVVNPSEKEVRKLLFQIIKYELLNNADDWYQVFTILLDGCSVLDSYEQTKEIIQRILFSSSINIKEIDLILLTTSIEITRARNLFGYSVDEKVSFCEDYTYKRFIEVYSKISMEIPYLNENDITVLYPLFHTFKYNYETGEIKISDFSKIVFSDFCSEVFDKYSIDLKESNELEQNILTHMEFMIRRILGGYELKNPILNEVKKKFPYSFEISMLIAPILFKYKKIYISEDEVSYLCIYVAHFLENINKKLRTLIITSQRHSVKNIVIKWLQDYFENQIEVVRVVNNYQVKKIDVSNFDLAIFLNDFATLPSIETYSIIGFPDLKDLEKLNKVIHTVRLNKRVSKILHQFIQPVCIHIYDELVNLEHVLADMSNSLHSRDILENPEKFYDDLIMREENYPTILGNKIMIPHALMTFTDKTGVEVALLKHPIKHADNNVQLLFVLALEKGHSDDISTLFSFFNQIAAHSKYVDNLILSQSSEEFIDRLHCFKLLE